jgi:hypothetical protein
MDQTAVDLLASHSLFVTGKAPVLRITNSTSAPADRSPEPGHPSRERKDDLVTDSALELNKTRL